MVGLGVEDEGTPAPVEPVVGAGDEVEGALGPDVGVDLSAQVAHLPVEGGLPIPAAGEVEDHIAQDAVAERIGAHLPLRLPRGVEAGAAHRLAVERPVVQAGAGVDLPFAAVRPRALPGILGVGHEAAGGGAVLGADHILQQDLLEGPVVRVGIADEVRRMGDDVARAVHQLPFIELVVDDLVADLRTVFRHVGLLVPDEGPTDAAVEYRGLEVVPRVVEEIADALQAERLTEGVRSRVALQLAQEITTEDVKGLLLVGAEGRGDEAHPRGGRDAVGGQGREPGAVLRHLLAVEVDREAERLVDGAHIGLPRLRDELVLVLGDRGERLQLPGAVSVRIVGHVALQVGVDGPVLAALVEAAEHVAVVAVAQAHVVGPALVLRDVLRLELGAEQAHLGAPCESLRPPVVDVQYRAHAVAVFRFETARRESDGLDHVGVGKGQSLLLACPHEEGAVDLDAIDIHQVLVEAAAAHIVGAGQFAGEVHRGLDEQVLDRSPYAGYPRCDARIDLLDGGGACPVGLHFRLIQRNAGAEDHVEAGALRGRHHLSGHGVIADEGEADRHLSGIAQGDVVPAVLVGDGGRTAALWQNRGSGEWNALSVRDPAVDPVSLGFGLHPGIDTGPSKRGPGRHQHVPVSGG